jgi:DNA processing protein
MTKPKPHQLSEAELISWIRLTRTTNVSRSTFFNLLNIFNDVKTAIENVEEFSVKGGLKKPIKPLSEAAAIQELEATRNFGANIIGFPEEAYPKMLREISDPPPILTIKGNYHFLNQDIIAVVGPRNASFNGCKFARRIAEELGKNDIVIASGLARGIDTAAHQASLLTGTVAVIAGGINNIYPPENTNLYNQIGSQGVIVSELPFGVAPRGGNFPQRNRIISGISLGVVIIEATLKSGTLITARFALEQNREIFAVPGSPLDPRHEGTNRLIKQGAKMLENVGDILNEIQHIRKNSKASLQFFEPESPEFTCFASKLPNNEDIDRARNLILNKLNFTEITNDEIINELEIPTRIVNIALVQLELADRIQNKNGKISLK